MRRRCLAFELEQVVAVEIERVGSDDAGGVDQPHQRHHGHRFTGARFADDGQYFTLFDAQGQAVHNRYGLGVAEADVEILDFKK